MKRGRFYRGYKQTVAELANTMEDIYAPAAELHLRQEQIYHHWREALANDSASFPARGIS